MNLYLVGYRCSGKTSVGRLLSGALGWQFVDMDQSLTAEAGSTIAEMVNRHGWKHFRAREARLLRRLSRESAQVVATGGGVVTVVDNIAVMRSSGKVIWLAASAGSIAQRMAADSDTGSQRPPLRGEDALSEIEQVLTERSALYARAMHLRVDTDHRRPKEVSERILAWMRDLGRPS
jgi:shikimate kinase